MDDQNNGINLQKSDNIEQQTAENLTESYPGTSAETLSTSAPDPSLHPVSGANTGTAVQNPAASNMKFCKFCGAQIHMDAVLCTSCGRQIEQLQGAASSQQPQIVINNANNNANVNKLVG